MLILGYRLEHTDELIVVKSEEKMEIYLEHDKMMFLASSVDLITIG